MDTRVTWLFFCAAILAFNPQIVVAQFGRAIEQGPEEVIQTSVDEVMPEDAHVILIAHNQEAAELRLQAEREIATRREKVIQALQRLQDDYTRAAKLDEAVAIRDRIRKLRFSHLKAKPNPVTLARYMDKVDEEFYFDVTGSTQGYVWGTDLYTADSTLAAAAVHAGVLKAGQRGIVKVTMTRTLNNHFGTELNGVRSMDWGNYPVSFTIERPLQVEPVPSEPAANR